MGWFLYDRDLRQKGVNCKIYYFCYCLFVSGTEHVLKITILFRKLLKITDLQHYDNDDTMELSSNSRVLLLPYIKKLNEILIIKPTQFLISCAIFVNWNFQERIYIFSNYFDKLTFIYPYKMLTSVSIVKGRKVKIKVEVSSLNRNIFHSLKLSCRSYFLIHIVTPSKL